MKMNFITNSKEKLIDRIKGIFSWAEEIDIAVAYVKTAGYNLVKNSLKNKKIRLLLELDF